MGDETERHECEREPVRKELAEITEERIGGGAGRRVATQEKRCREDGQEYGGDGGGRRERDPQRSQVTARQVGGDANDFSDATERRPAPERNRRGHECDSQAPAQGGGRREL